MASSCCKKTKGQLTLTEFMLVSTVLIGLVGASIAFWNHGNEVLRFDIERKVFENSAASVSGQLVNSPGKPLDWYNNPNKIVSIGLADYDRELSQARINGLLGMDYDQIRDHLGVRNYQLLFKISSLDESVKFEKGTAPSDPEIAVNSRRVATLNDEIVYVDVTLWR